MKIHVYAICWNEEKMLPFFFNYYDNIVDQYFIYDNGSTDRSLSILKAHPKVNIDSFVVDGDSLVMSAMDLFNQFWKRSKGKADWIIVCDLDEHLYHPDLRSYLEKCQSEGKTLVIPAGYEMVSDFFPNSTDLLHETIREGVRTHLYDKPQIFNPNEIEEMNFAPGRHSASPVGNIVSPPTMEVCLLHYKYLGFEYVNARHLTLKQGLRKNDIAHAQGVQYLWNEQYRLGQYLGLKNAATRVL